MIQLNHFVSSNFIVKIKNIMRVCILGDGLSALTLAKALINQNIFVDMLVKKKINNINQTRTLGISKYNLDFFNKNIINIEKLIWKINSIEIFTDNLKDEKLLNFKNGNSQLFSIIKNSELFKILEKNLLKNKYFKKVIINHDNISLVRRL
jgi:2-octaprenyl-6-methoxyphenol hydroxylase